jgi:alkylated DNA nucleotide flippase Atl1
MRAVRRLVVALVLGLGVALAPASLSAWGMDVHRAITRRALAGLPAPLQAFYAAKADFISEHSADPDLWRVVDLRGELGTEDPNHFLDIDMFGDPPPFRSVPREWSAVVQQYGIDTANKLGRLPWRADEIYGRLIGAFQGIPQGTPSYAGDNARYLSAVLAHYVEDAHVPFHGSANYDGQATNQRGIHSRFETELVLQYQARLTLAPVAIKPIPNMRDFIFDALIESQSLVAPVLAADLKAKAGRDRYDDEYYAAFFAGAKPIVEKRYSDAASAVASAIVSAWEKAGKPALPTDAPKPPARRSAW